MTNKRIPQLDALTGAASANDDSLVIFDASADTTKRILRSQLAIGVAGDIPFTPTGFVSSTTLVNAVTEIVTDVSAAGGAALIGNTPAGAISSTTVQAAINELDSEKVAAATLAAAGGAALVGNTPAGNISSTTVQAALNELDSEKTSSATLAAAGGATLVGNTPAGDIVATTVQAAINELDSDKVPRTSTTGAAIIPAGTSAQQPTPVTGMFRFNTDLVQFEGYNGTVWGAIGGGGGASVTTSDTPPVSPSDGDLWWDTASGQMYIYYDDGTSSQWVVANSYAGSTAYLPLTGGTLTGNLAVTGTLNVTSGATLSSTLSVTGATTFSGAMSATAAAYMEIDTLTDGATITPDFGLGNNFSVTLGGNRTLANPTNLTAGQSGVIFISQDGTGSRTLAYGSSWDFPNATAPTLTTTASAVDVLVYTVRSSTSIAAQLISNIG